MSKRRMLEGLAIVAVFAARTAWAQDPAAAPTRPWSNVTDLGIAATSGNSESKNFAFSNKYAYKWTNSEFNLDAAALRAESTTRTITNIDGVVSENKVTTTTAEIYAIDAKYKHNISERFFWYVRAGWVQNKPAGIDSRLLGGGGLGYTFIKSDTNLLTGELGVEYTDEQYTQPTFIPGEIDAVDSNNFATARGFLGYEHKFNANSKFNGELEAWDNLDETSDWRARAMASFTASMTSKLALKVAYTLLYDAEPVVIDVADTGAPPADPGQFEFDDTDSIFTATLVITY